MNRYHASKLFMGAAAIGERGVMQADVVLIQAEQKLMDKADQLVVLVDSSKFAASATFLVCALSEVDIVITDEAASEADIGMLKRHDIEVIIAH
jgi:DeoR family ulaG and ulaABCDEF operon transcriptional repressor